MFQYQGGNLMRSAGMKNAQQQSFFDQLARGISNYQQGQDRQLQKDIYMKKAEAEANDPKKLGTEYMIKDLMSRGMTRDQAAAEIMNAKSGGMQFDPLTQEMIQKPSLFDALSIPRGGNGIVAAQPSGKNWAGVEQGPLAASQNAITSRQAEIGANKYQRDFTEDDLMPMDEEIIYDSLVTGADTTGMAGTRAGRMKQYDQNLAMDKVLKSAIIGTNESLREKKESLPIIAEEKRTDREIELDYQKRLEKYKQQINLDAEEKAKIPGRVSFDNALEEVLKDIEALNESGGVVNKGNNVLQNVMAYGANTKEIDPFGILPAGQDFGRMVGSKEQSLRDQIDGKIPVLFNAIKKASGLSGTELNSAFEIENQLKQLGLPTMEYGARIELLRDLSNQFGTGKFQNYKPKPVSKPDMSALKQQAQDAINRGADPAAVEKRLQEMMNGG